MDEKSLDTLLLAVRQALLAITHAIEVYRGMKPTSEIRAEWKLYALRSDTFQSDMKGE